MIVKCPKCGALVSDKSAFCVKCGAPLTADVAPESSTTPQSAPTSASVPSHAPTPVGDATKRQKLNTILLCSILAFLVLGIIAYFIFAGTKNETRGVPQEDSTYASDYRQGADLVYADSYDGFLNIRATPSSKGTIIGKFRNGPQGAVKLGVSGNWMEVECDGVVGYVSKSHVSYTPTKEVTVDVDDKWLMGPWYPSHKEYAYLLFNNGTYTVQYEYGALAYGTYRLEGNEIIFNATVVMSGRYDIGSYERHRIIVSPKRIGHLTKRSLIKQDAKWEHYGELVWTWAEYAELKKQTREYVR